MPSSFSAMMRRTSRLMGAGPKTKALRKSQSALATSMVKAAMAPMVKAQKQEARKQKTAARRSLGAVVAQLSGAPARKPKRRVAPAIPTDARYLSRRHRCSAGARSYKLYLPASHPGRLNGLIVMLHGCGQTADDFALGTNMNAQAEKHGLAIAYPAQTRAHNAGSCWNWFKPGDQTRGAGEPALLASLARKLMREFDIGRECTFVAGLSAGGAMAAILADVYPDVFAAAGIHSGLRRGAANDVGSAMTAMRRGRVEERAMRPAGLPREPMFRPVCRIIFQGDRDSTVHPANAAHLVEAAQGRESAPDKVRKNSVRGRGYERHIFSGSAQAGEMELWMLAGGEHAWSGGRKAGTYTDTKGPNATAQMVRFFLAQSS